MPKETTLSKADDLIARYPALEVCRNDLLGAIGLMCESFDSGHKLLTCGNGGSASDAEHIVGELMKGFLSARKLDEDTHQRLKALWPEDAEYLYQNLQGALPAVALVDQTALNTAFANDQAADLSFAQQVLGLGEEGDVLLAITTSGNSKNVLYAVETAKLKGVRTIALTGRSGGKIKAMADISICVPADETYLIQEYHLPVYHMLCIAAEEEFFGH